jgi:hypothetical protein
MPLAPQGQFQSCERGKAWKIFSSLDALNITRTRSNFFRQNFLCQTPPASQESDIFTEPRPMWAPLGLARRHWPMLVEMQAVQHEALHRAENYFNFVA